MFGEQMLAATRLGFAGRYVTEFVNEQTGHVIVVTMSILKEAGMGS